MHGKSTRLVVTRLAVSALSNALLAQLCLFPPEKIKDSKSVWKVWFILA